MFRIKLLGYGMLAPAHSGGVPLLDRIDHVASNVLLPLSGISIALLVGWAWRGTAARSAADLAATVAGPMWYWSMRLVLPAVIGLVMSRGLGWI